MSDQIIHVDFHRRLPDLAPAVPNVPTLCVTLRTKHLEKLTAEHLRYIRKCEQSAMEGDDKPIMMRRLHALLKICNAVDWLNGHQQSSPKV